MQNTNSNTKTKTFSPPEGGFTAEQVAEYEELKTTDAEWQQYGELLKTGHRGSWASIAQAGDGRSFNEIFGNVEIAKTASQNVNTFVFMAIRIKLCLNHQSLPVSSSSINVFMSAPKFF